MLPAASAVTRVEQRYFRIVDFETEIVRVCEEVGDPLWVTLAVVHAARTIFGQDAAVMPLNEV